ncbi:MAG: hypothetical protein LC672_04815, partial [Acidobacteria bacterium]|nr:hypothetical protein [Acidobacteriota bacterium]
MNLSAGLTRLKTLPPPIILLGGVLCGLLLVVASFVAGVSFRQQPGGKEVGYIYAINWSLNYTIVLPFMLYFLFASFQKVDGLITRLAKNKMVVDEDWRVQSKEALRDGWDGMAMRTAKLRLLLTALALIFCLGEWYLNSALPLYTGQTAGLEQDWAVAFAAQDAPAVNKLGNAVFTFFCFLLQWVAASAVLDFCVFMCMFSLLIYRHSQENSAVKIVPDLDSEDARRGFQVFQPLMENVMFTAIFAFAMFYLTRLQNLYLRAPNVNNIGEFVRSEILLGMFSKDRFSIDTAMGSGGLSN